MSNYRIVTDSCCDFPRDLLATLDIDMVNLTLMFRGQELTDPTDAQTKEMYDALQAGETATTSAVNPEGWKQALEPVLASGKDALVMAFSSGLSTTYQSAVIASQELMEAYPDRTIKVVDTVNQWAICSLVSSHQAYSSSRERPSSRFLQAYQTYRP